MRSTCPRFRYYGSGAPADDRMIRYAGVRTALAASLALALLAPMVTAQEPGARLTGILLSEGDGAPVDGAVVSVDGPDGVVVWETLSNSSGAFSLPLPPPGTYRVRVSRIGYESWTSGPVRIDSAQATGPLRLEVPVRAVPLPELMVTEQTDCPTTPEERRRAFELYESVLPALVSMSAEEVFDSLVVRLDRPVRVWRRGSFRYVQDTVTVVVPKALNNAAPTHLEAFGYAEAVNDSTTTFYAPDGEALASPGFLATHCLSTTKAEDEVTAGLSFQPRLDRDVVDVQGVLWIDTVAVEPQKLEFRYTSLRPFLRRYLLPNLESHVLSRRQEELGRRVRFHAIELIESDYGGALHFERIEGGGWLVREWRIVRPRLAIFFRSDVVLGAYVQPKAVPLTHSGRILAIFRSQRDKGGR